MDNLGTVYLIHFEAKYKHAQHYIGFCKGDWMDRFREHKKGRGSKLLKAVNAAGIEYKVVKAWLGVSRKFERQLKNRKNARKLCPACQS